MKYAIIMTLIVLGLCVLPAAAVIQEVTVKGTVSALDKGKNTLTLANPAQYGCSYPATGGPVCTYSQMTDTSLTGTVPAETAFSVFQAGDTVIATSLGGAGGTWITVAKLYGALPSEEYVTDVVGDPSTLTAPLIGDYALDLSTKPDCTTCYGTICTATTSTVNILSGNTRLMVKTLEPRQAMVYSGKNDGSSVRVTFIKGEASSSTCLGGYGLTGPQPVSVYIVDVAPPIGFGGQVAETPAVATPDVTAPVPTTTAKSGVLPIVVVGALAIVTFLMAARRE